MGKEVVIFCAAYPQINNALYVAWQNFREHPTSIVIHGDGDLFKFFKVINEKVFNHAVSIIYFDVYRRLKTKPDNTIRKIIYYFPDIIRERHYLKQAFNRYLAELRGAEVYFFSRYFCPYEYYLLPKLDNSNKFVFMPASVYDSLGIHQGLFYSFKEIVYLTRWKLAYGCGIGIARHSLGQMVLCMPDKFIKKRVFKVIEREERDRLLKDLDLRKFRVFNLGNYDVMYFHDDLIGGGYGYITDSASFTNLLSCVIGILRKHFQENKIARKYHPTPGAGDTMEQFGELLPDYIPAEFLYNDKVKMYLGLSSMALANVEQGLAVSLIDMVKFRDDETRKRLKEIVLHVARTKILFPQSLDEFEQILKSVGAGNK